MKIILPEGLELGEGVPSEYILESIAPNQIKQVSWSVTIQPNDANRVLNYSIILDHESFPGIEVSKSITIPADNITELKMEPEAVSLKLGQTKQLKVTGLLASGENKDFTPSETGTIYTSSNENSVTVSPDGLVNVLPSAVTGTVYIRAYNNEKMTVCAVNVQGLSETALRVETESLSLERGQTYQLNTFVELSNGSRKDVTSIINGTTYTSSQPDIAAVNSNGLITVSPNSPQGTVVIDVRYGNFTAPVLLTINAPSLDRLIVDPNNLSLEAGTSSQLNITAVMSDGTRENVTSGEKGTSYISSDTSKITVSDSGLVSVPANASSGIATITIKYGNQEVLCNVRINELTVRSIEVLPNEVTLETGSSQQFQVIATMGDGSRQDITESADTTYTRSSSYVSINSTGFVIIDTDTPDGKTITITATYKGVSGTSVITVEDNRPVLMSIEFDESQLTMAPEERRQLTLFALKSDGTREEITDSSEIRYTRSLSYASVSTEGEVSLASSTPSGKIIIITATYQGKSSTSTITVEDTRPVLTGIEFDESQLTMAPEERRQLTLFALKSDGTREEITDSSEIRYTRSLSYASVSTEGEVSLASSTPNGKVITITATYQGKSSTSIITVEDTRPVLTGIEFDESQLTMAPEERRQLKVFALKGDGTREEITDSSEIRYTRSLSYASVSTEGEVSLASSTPNGKVITITATYQGKSSTSTITVEDTRPVLTGIEFDESQLTMAPEERRQLKVFALKGDGTREEITDSSEIRYTRSLSYASVSTEGEVSLASSTPNGKVITIKAAYQGKSSTSTITVEDTRPVLTGIEFDESQLTMAPEERRQLKVFALKGDGTREEITDSSEIRYTRSLSYASVSYRGRSKPCVFNAEWKSNHNKGCLPREEQYKHHYG